MLVSQAEAPKLPHIPCADKETDMLLNLVREADINAARISGKDATISRVKEAMISYNSIHFACHASQDASSPLNSGFHLLDERLGLSEIMKLQIPNANFAFLSACQTSAGDEKLAEEAVHLAAGMLAAGYRSVIATMWSIKDDYGPEIAELFYSQLLESGPHCGGEKRQIDGAKTAYALHHATRRFREKLGDTEEALLTWVPYVHFGI